MSLVSMPVSDSKYEGRLQAYSSKNRGECCSFSAAPEVTRLPVWSLNNLKNITKVKVVSFLLGLTLTFLIMASYILTWDRKGLPLPPSPFQLRPVVAPTSTAASELPAERNYIDIGLLAKIVDSNLDYMSRKVPDEREVIASDPQLFSAIPRRFLPGIKSPCWLEEFSGDVNVDPYSQNRFTLRSKSFKAVCDRLKANFQGHLYHREGKQYRLRCLPYFYIIGQPKCGTTDVFHRLQLHPEVKFTTMKEPHWWTRKRFGYIRFKDGFQDRFPVEDYLDLFDLAAYHIEEGMVGNSSGDHSKLQLITGEASASTMWDNQAWSYLHNEEDQETEPWLLAQDFIHAVQPDAKIIVMLRDPVERLYSDYLYFKMTNKSLEDFHLKVTESIRLFQSCVSKSSLHFCVYNTTLSNSMPVRLSLGMYIVFLLDWLAVFHREQILVLRLEDYATNHRLTMKTVFDFLGVGHAESALTKRPISNSRRAADRTLGPMLPATRDLLRDFHQPFNLRLARLLGNRDFLWTDT